MIRTALESELKNINPYHLSIFNAIVTGQAQIYFIFENLDYLLKEDEAGKSEELIQEIYLNFNHFMKVFNFPFRVLFVTQRNIDLPIPKIIISYPSDEKLARFVSRVISTEIESNDNIQKIFNRVFMDSPPFLFESNTRSLVTNIVSSLSYEVKDFKTFEAIAKKTIHYVFCVVSDVREVNKLTQGFFTSIAKPILKYFYQNPKAAFKHFKDINQDIERLTSSDMANPAFEQVTSSKELLRFTENQLAEKFNLPPIPAILLISCFIVNSSTESRDLYNLKNVHGGKKTKGEAISKSAKIKPSSKERIEAMAQHLMSLAYEGTRGIREHLQIHQTLQFITSYKLLEQFRLIRR